MTSAIEGPRILTVDIETSPSLAYIWRLFDENIGISQIVDSTEMLCFAAKWYGEKKVHYFSQYEHGQETMVKEIYDMMDEADIVVHFNGKRFDVPHINREILLANMTPPSPIRQIDLLQVVRQRFKFTSNKLDYVVQQLGLGAKMHKGVDFSLWKGCLDNDPDAWRIMEKYNKQDVVVTEKLFDRIKPWLGNLAHVGLYTGVEHCCNICGSENLQKRGFKYSGSSVFQQYVCNDCGAWSQGNKRVAKTDTKGII